jgi:hypothetical protein
MREGVLKEIERKSKEEKKVQNLDMLKKQIELERDLKAREENSKKTL